MTREARASRNWFDQGGNAYSRFRPEYPPDVAQYLASLAPGTELAVDVGCGSSQLTAQLAAHFKLVFGVDPSAEQIANAAKHPRVEYVRAAAERLPLADQRAQLISAAQAAHWFNLPAFYAEVRRVCAPGAIVALVSYGVMQLDEQLAPLFNRFYRDEIGPYWPEERKLVDSGYVDLSFPFDELPMPHLEIRRAWNLEELLGYISTWSAVRRASELGREDISNSFAASLVELWGNSMQRREVRWPINMRIGRL